MGGFSNGDGNITAGTVFTISVLIALVATFLGLIRLRKTVARFQDWTKTNAIVTELVYDQLKPNKIRLWRVRYRYQHKGHTFECDKVFPQDYFEGAEEGLNFKGEDFNLDSREMRHDLVANLFKAYQQKTPVKGLVNPNNPMEALLIQDLGPYKRARISERIEDVFIVELFSGAIFMTTLVLFGLIKF